jgi:plasmid maintenance system antidote protein VapI
MPRGGKQSPVPDDKKKRIVELYLENTHLNVKAVADQVGCAPSTVWNILVANDVEIRGRYKWLNEKADTQRILRRWDGGKSSKTIARIYGLQREGVARVIAANRPYNRRMRKMLRAVFGAKAETLAFLRTISFARNSGPCAICHTKNGRLVKDYCHQTGTLRDLLCGRCRQGLGCFADDLTKMRKALAYLMKHSSVPAGSSASAAANGG